MDPETKRRNVEQSDGEEPALTINIDGEGSSSETYKSETHLIKNSEKLQKFLTNGQLCDIRLKCGDLDIQAHRNILSAASEYFAATFTGLLNVASNEIELDNVLPNELHLIVNFCYTGEISINDSNIEPLLNAARFLQVNDVVELCSEYLIKQLHASNWLGVRNFADAHGCLRLTERANGFAMDNFMDVAEEKEYLQLSVDELINFLSSDLLRVPCEDSIFYAICIWLREDLANRRQYIDRLLHYIRLPYISNKFVGDFIEKNALFGSDPICRKLAVPENKRDCNPRRYLPAKLYVVAGCPDTRDQDDIVLAIYCCHPDNNLWSLVRTIDIDRSEFGIAVVDNRIFICGGCDTYDDDFSSVESWNSGTDIVERNVGHMNTARRGLSVAVLENYIYVIGGSAQQACLSSAERWDSNSLNSSFEFIAEMSTARCNAGAAVLHGRIYVVGGEGTDWKGQRTVEWYSPDTNTWSSCASMNTGRGCLGVGVLNDLIYAVGGREKADSLNCFSSVERYDPKLDQWTLVASMRKDRFGMAVVGFGEVLLCFVGGMNGSSIVECYDEKSNEWAKVADLNNIAYFPSVALMRSTITADQVLFLKRTYEQINNQQFNQSM